MLTVAVLDNSAEARTDIVERITFFLKEDLSQADLFPRINLRSLSMSDLRHTSAPDVCVVGTGVLREDLCHLAQIRKQIPAAAILAFIDDDFSSLATIEQLARLGVDDVIGNSTTAFEFFRKIVMLSKKFEARKSGKLILVDSGKGGVGTTTIAAGLAEILIDLGKRVVVLDFDSQTQDLSRFLQAKPFVNENLQALFDRKRPVTDEFVMQCIVPVWEDSGLYCLTPIPEQDLTAEQSANHARVLLSVLEVLDSQFDYIVCDAGGMRGLCLRSLYRVADKVLLVLNNDAATLYASAEQVNKARAYMAADSELLLVENSSDQRGVPNKLLRDEFNRVARIGDHLWSKESIPYCKLGSKWAASGASIVGLGNKRIFESFIALTRQMGFLPPQENKSASTIKLLKGLTEKILTRRFSKAEDSQTQARTNLLSGPEMVGLPYSPVGIETEDYRFDQLVSGAKPL